MSTFGEFGNGVGFVYQTLADGTTMVIGMENTTETSRYMRAMAQNAAPLAGERLPFGSFDIEAVTAAGEFLNTTTIDGNNQHLSPIALTDADVITSAADIATQINTDVAAAGPDYSASSVDVGGLGTIGRVFLYGPPGNGITLNGDVLAPTATANVTIGNIQNIGNGTDPQGVFDAAIGYRFFLNTDAGAQNDILAGVEISRFINNRGLETSIPVLEVAPTGTTIVYERQAAIMTLVLTGAGGNIRRIEPTDAVIGDELRIISDQNSFTLNDIVTGSDNLSMSRTMPFTTITAQEAVVMHYLNDVTFGIGFYEQRRSGAIAATVAEQRDIGQPTAPLGVNIISVPTGGTETIVAGTDPHVIELTDTQTLAAGYEVVVDDTDAKDNDQFWVSGEQAIITLSGNTLTIFGQPINAELALAGGWVVRGVYDGTTVQAQIMVIPKASTISGAAGVGNQIVADSIDTADVAPLAIGDAEISDVDGTKIAAGSIPATAFDGTFDTIQTLKVTIPSAQVLGLFTTRHQILPTPGVGKWINVMNVYARIIYGGVAYASTADVHLGFPTGGGSTHVALGVLAETSDQRENFSPQPAGVGNEHFTLDEPLEAFCLITDPTLGNSDIDIYVWYTTVTD